MNDLKPWFLEALLWGGLAVTWAWSFKMFSQVSATPTEHVEKVRLFNKLSGRQWLLGALLWGEVAWIWAWSFKIFAQASAEPIKRLDKGSLFTALFGASSIALFILSLLVATLAILGWQSLKDYIEDKVGKAIRDRGKEVDEAIKKRSMEVDEAIEKRNRRIDEAIKERTQALENELRGRVATILGYTIGEMSLMPGSFKVRDRDRLGEAVVQCKAGYHFLRQIGGPAEFLGLNNLVFYTCVFEDGLPKANEDWMLASARLLKDAGQQRDNNMLKLTACRVLLEYGAEPGEKERARNILNAMADKRSTASERERKEAKFYLSKYSGQTAIISNPEAGQKREALASHKEAE
jgi:hypothetical protein